MRETKKTSAGLDVKMKKFDSLYHAIRGFINMIQGKTDPNDSFNLRYYNIYETIKLSSGDNILRSKQITNNGSQESTKEKQFQIYQMKTIWFLFISD